MTEQPTDANPLVPPWSGFHHIALVTRDLDATMRFYRDVLGMEIIFSAPAGDLHGRHCAFRPGGDLDRLGLHFFEYPGAPLFGQTGKVIGVNFGVFTENTAANMAVPVRFALDILKKAGWKSPEETKQQESQVASANANVSVSGKQ